MKPIIFIPGIQATSLVNSNSFNFNYIWNAYDSIGSSLSTTLLGSYITETLQLDPLYDAGIETIIERGHIAKLPYEASIVKLKQKMGNNDKYKDTPVYLFGYDWRMSNMESGRRLKVFVEYLKNKLKDKNVEGFKFITHSMGGLVLSCYLNQLDNDYSDIDKIVMNAPPFLGSPYALVHMVKGDGGLKSILNWAVGRNEDVRKVIRTYPGVFELVPVYDGAVRYNDDGTQLDLFDIDDWQSNIPHDIKDIFSARLELLRKFRSPEGMKNLAELPERVRNKMVIVVGEDEKPKDYDTFTNIMVDREVDGIRNFIDLNSLKRYRGSGDGTVPFISSTAYADSIQTYAIKKENFFDELSNNVDFHGLFLRDSRVQNIIERFLLCEDVVPPPKEAYSWWESPGGSVRRV